MLFLLTIMVCTPSLGQCDAMLRSSPSTSSRSRATLYAQVGQMDSRPCGPHKRPITQLLQYPVAPPKAAHAIAFWLGDRLIQIKTRWLEQAMSCQDKQDTNPSPRISSHQFVFLALGIKSIREVNSRRGSRTRWGY